MLRNWKLTYISDYKKQVKETLSLSLYIYIYIYILHGSVFDPGFHVFHIHQRDNIKKKTDYYYG